MKAQDLVLVAGGGTAGHVLPAVPVIEKILNSGTQVVYIGSNSGLEERLVQHLELKFVSITTGKFRRYFSWQNLVDFFRVPVSILQSLFFVRRYRPKVVYANGGYVAFPVVMAAWLMRVPVVAHESDLTPGLATRLCMPFVRTLCVNFAETKTGAVPTVVTGTPIRKELLAGDPKRGREWLRFKEDVPVVLVVGGSLGAESLNRVVYDSLTDLLKEWIVVHVCGTGKLNTEVITSDRYRQLEYINEQWGDVFALADVVVSRAGANTIAELLALGKPSLLVPLPLEASRGDQIENATLLQSRGLSMTLEERNLSSENLVSTIRNLFQQLPCFKKKLATYQRRESTRLILDELDRISH